MATDSATSPPSFIAPPPPRPRAGHKRRPPVPLNPLATFAQANIRDALANRLEERRQAFARAPITLGQWRKATAFEIRALAMLLKRPGHGWTADGLATDLDAKARAAMAMALSRELASTRRAHHLAMTATKRRPITQRMDRLTRLLAITMDTLGDDGRAALTGYPD